MAVESLWPENIGEVQIKSPVNILREQAALLGEHTRNIVEARVGDNQNFQNSSQELLEPFNYEFFIVAKLVNNYHYGLFYISHGFDLYPVTFHVSDDIYEELGFRGKNDGIAVDGEEYFKEILGKILRSRKTRQVIQAILAQVEERNLWQAPSL